MPYTAFTAANTASTIRTELEREDEDFALRMLVGAVGELREAIAGRGPTTVEAFMAEPPASTGSTRWDTLIAGQIGRELRRANLPLPAWARPKPLRQWWFVGV